MYCENAPFVKFLFYIPKLLVENRPMRYFHLCMRSLLALLFLCPVFLLADGQKLKISVSAGSGILINAKTGAVLWAKNPHAKKYPASIAKIATVAYFLEKTKGQGLDRLIDPPRECLFAVSPTERLQGRHPSYRLETHGSSMGIQNGEQLSIEDLLHGALIQSGNDACNVLSHVASGNISAFLEELNAYLQALGLKNTTLVNPHGLFHKDQVTSAYDMALLAKRAMENPLFRSIVCKQSYPRPKTSKQAAMMMSQHNALLKPGPYYYPKATGIKTGTASFGKTLVASAEDEKRSLIAVLLDCKDAKQRFRDAIALFDAAFEEKEMVRTLFAKGSDTFTTEVFGGKHPVKGRLFNDLQLSFYPSEESEIKALLEWEALQMPIREGDRVAEIRLLNERGQVVKSAPLFAMEDVEPTLWFEIQTFFKEARRSLFMFLAPLSLILLIVLRSRGLRKRRSTA